MTPLLDALPVSGPVGVDSAPLIYFFEGHATYGPLVQPFFRQRVKSGANPIITSTVTLSELLVHPIRNKQFDVVARYRRFLAHGRNVTMVAVDPSVAEHAATLRATHGIRLPDAFQIAAALQHGATHFLTNDDRLRKVTELTVVVLERYTPAHPA